MMDYPAVFDPLVPLFPYARLRAYLAGLPVSAVPAEQPRLSGFPELEEIALPGALGAASAALYSARLQEFAACRVVAHPPAMLVEYRSVPVRVDPAGFAVGFVQVRPVVRVAAR